MPQPRILELIEQSLTQMDGQALTVVELHRNEKLHTEWHLQRLIQNLGDWDEILVVTNTAGCITYVNQTFEEITGFSLSDAMGKSQMQLLGGEKNRQLYSQMWSRLQAGKSFRGIFHSRKKKARRFYEERYARPFVSEDGSIDYYIFTSRDVSERERLIQHLAHLANHDELTGLPNRHLFIDRLQQAQAQGARSAKGFCLLLLDLDDFKLINDQFGHAAGDAVLMSVAKRLRSCVREADTTARLGGDEFAIILNNIVSTDDVQQVLNNIITILRKPIMFAGLGLPSHASIGLAYYPQDSDEIEDLLNLADIAMYNAKAAGGNGFNTQHQGINSNERIPRRRHANFSPGKIDVRKFILNDNQTNKVTDEVRRNEDPNANTEK